MTIVVIPIRGTMTRRPTNRSFDHDAHGDVA